MHEYFRGRVGSGVEAGEKRMGGGLCQGKAEARSQGYDHDRIASNPIQTMFDLALPRSP